MKKNILSMAALLIASAAVFTACSSDDNVTSEQPANPTGKYTMTVQASKGGDATTRALSLDETTSPHKLNATWATTENVYVKNGDNWAGGSLQPQTAGETATLKGTLTDITIEAGDELTLQFPKSGTPVYSGQVGTLADIAAKYDYATATVTVKSVSASGNIVPTAATTTFENQQAIVKFTLIDKADGTTSLSASQLVINDGTTDYTITPASNTSVIYAAIPGFTGKTVTLTATVGDDTYTYEKTGVSFTNGKYYEITVKMTKQTVPVTAITLNKTETSIKVGSTETLSVTAVAPDNATDKTYTWKTSDETKATVDQDGKVTAVAAGTVTIYAEANDGSGVKGNCTVTVTPATITVTWNNDDITGTTETSCTKDGVTMNVTGGECDFIDKNFSVGTFTSTVGNFTKIEVTASRLTNMGSDWAIGNAENNYKKATWTGTASSTVSFGGSAYSDGIWGEDEGVTMVFTIEPTN